MVQVMPVALGTPEPQAVRGAPEWVVLAVQEAPAGPVNRQVSW